MRLNGLVLVASAVVLAGCSSGSGGSDKTASSGETTPAPAPAATAGAATTPAAGTATPLPITGKTWEVKMINDQTGYRFEPATLTIKVGDGVKFVNAAGGPHNVAFNTLPDASKGQLDANMPSQTSAGPAAKIGELSGPLMVNIGDAYTVSFAGVKPGTYEMNCTPHLAMNMRGTITVQ